MKTKKPSTAARGGKRVSALVRLPEDVMAELDAEAKREGVSRNQLVTRLIADLVDVSRRNGRLIAGDDDQRRLQDAIGRATAYAFAKAWPKSEIQRLLFFFDLLQQAEMEGGGR